MDGEDRREQRATRPHLTARWESIRTLFEHAPETVALLDPEREAILELNPPACRLWACSREDLLALPMHVICRNQMRRCRAFARSVLQAGSGRLADLSRVTQTSHAVRVPVSASVVAMEGRR